MPDAEVAPEGAPEVKLCGILVSRNKPKKGYVDISGTTYAYADWVEPFLSRHVNGDVVDVIYKQHRNGGKTLVSIQKAKDPTKAVPVQASQEPAYKTGTQIMQHEKQGAKPDPAPAAQKQPNDSASSPAVTAADAVQMWSAQPTIEIESTVNLTNYENLRVRVSGAAADEEKLVRLLDTALGRFGRNHEATRECVDSYRRRVLA
jgi:hypothetical protein